MDEIQKSNQSERTDLRENPKGKTHSARESFTIIQRKLQWW